MEGFRTRQSLAQVITRTLHIRSSNENGHSFSNAKFADLNEVRFVTDWSG